MMLSLILSLLSDLFKKLSLIRREQEQNSLTTQSILVKLDRVLTLIDPGTAEDILFFDGSMQLIGDKKMEMRDDQQVHVTIEPVNKKGKPAPVDGVPVWASSDETVVTVTAGSDGMSADVVAVAPGTARVVVTADADLGEGSSPLTGTLDVTITAGGAVAINITAGTPTDQV